MCMSQPKLPQQVPFTPPPAPLAPPPPAATATTVSAANAAPAVAPKAVRKNPLRTDQGGDDSVATGLNIPV